MRKGLYMIMLAVWGIALLAGCGGELQDAVLPSSQAPSPDTGLESPQTEPEATQETDEKEQAAMKMNVQIGGQTFTATMEDNQAAKELADMMKAGPVTLQMDDFSGFEKVGSLGRNLTASNKQTTTTAGDIVLYNGSNIVMFYGSNSWSYTRLGKIDDLTGWADALGRGSVHVTFRLAHPSQTISAWINELI